MPNEAEVDPWLAALRAAGWSDRRLTRWAQTLGRVAYRGYPATRHERAVLAHFKQWCQDHKENVGR